MKVTFRNIGPVAKAELDLSKRLILLCGPNNTGKTYISYCLYGLHKLRLLSGFSFTPALEKLLEADKDGVIRFEAAELIKALRPALKNYFEREFKKSLASLFAVGDVALDRFFGETGISISMPSEEDMMEIVLNHSYSFSIDYREGFSLITIKNSGEASYTIQALKKQNQKSEVEDLFYFTLELEDIIKEISAFLLSNAFIAPVERNSIFTFSRELAMKRNDLVDEMLRMHESSGKKTADPLNYMSRRAMRYPMPIRDGLRIAEDLSTISKSVSEYARLADQLEKTLLGGRVVISKEGGVEYSPSKSRSLKIPIQLTASVVKSLSGLVIFFRHVAQKGDLIIIDEPELNLHPDAQIGFARFMAQLLHEGFQLAITTHSDYIIRELNNLMMVEGLRQREAEVPEVYNTENIIGIRPEHVGAFLFGPPKTIKNKKIEMVPLEVSETGFTVDTIDTITASLNNISQDLYFELMNSDDQEDEEA